MNQRVKALVDEARKLTPEERLELLDELSRVVDGEEPADGTPEEIEAAWLEEVERRLDADERGEKEGIDADDVMAAARARRGAARAAKT